MFGDKTKESIDDDSQAFKELTDAAVYLITTKVPVIERPVILRNQAKALSLSLSTRDVYTILAKARRDIEGID